MKTQWHHLLAFFKALTQRWWLAALGILSLISTASTFLLAWFPHFAIGRWVSVGVFSVTFLVACFLVFVDRQIEIENLRHDTANLRIQIADLEAKSSTLAMRQSIIVLHVDSAIFYRMGTPGNVYATLFRFKLFVENKGTRNATIARFELAVKEISKAFPELKPFYKDMVQTTKAQVGFSGEGRLAADGTIAVDAEKASKPGYLSFYVPTAIPEDLHELHCVLALTDTENTTGRAEVLVPEY